MRLPELDKEAIKVQPLPTERFSNGVPDVGKNHGKGQVVRYMDRDLPKIQMLGCDCLECRDDPFDAR
jgi:hypothetical protein